MRLATRRIARTRKQLRQANESNQWNENNNEKTPTDTQVSWGVKKGARFLDQASHVQRKAVGENDSLQHAVQSP